MSGALKGFLLTSAGWLVLVGMYSLIEIIRGHMPFEMLQWSLGGKYITVTILFVLAIGTLAGHAGDQIRERSGRQ